MANQVDNFIRITTQVFGDRDAIRRMVEVENAVERTRRVQARQIGETAEGLARIDRAANFFVRSVEESGNKLAQVGKNALTFSTSFLGFIVVNETLKAFGAATLGSVRAAAEFEQGLARVGKTTDLSGGQLKQLGSNFREIARTTPLATSELLKVGEIAGQIGVSGVRNITTFSETISKLAQSTNLSAEEGATALARFSNITNLPTEKITNLSSTLVDLGNKFASSESEITEFSLRLAGAGNVLGLTAQNILGFANALASVGVNAEAGGTAFSRVFLTIDSAASSGGIRLQRFAQIAGVTAESFKALVANDPSQAVIRFVQGIRAIQASGQDLLPILEGVGLNEIRVRDSLLRASAASDLFARSLSTANTAFAQNTALQIEFERQSATTASKSQILANNIKDIQISLGETALPGAAATTQTLADFLQALRGQEGESASGDAIRDTFETIGKGVQGVAAVTRPLREAADSFSVLGSSVTALTQVLAALTSYLVLEGILQFARNLNVVASAGSNLNASLLRLAGGPIGTTSTFTRPFGGQLQQLGRTPSNIFLPGGVPLIGRPGTQIPQFAQFDPATGSSFTTNAGGRFIPISDAAAAAQNTRAAAQIQASFAQNRLVDPLQRNALGTGSAARVLGLGRAGAALALGSPVATITSTALAVSALNEVLERTSGEGLLELFSTAEERANAFNNRLKELTDTLNVVKLQISRGTISTEGGIDTLFKNLANDITNSTNELEKFNEARNKPNRLGLSTEGTFGAVSDFLGKTPLTKTLLQKPFDFLSGEQQVRDREAELEGQLNATQTALLNIAREFNLTIADLARRKLELSVGLSEESKKTLENDFKEVINIISGEQFASTIENLSLVGNITADKLETRKSRGGEFVPGTRTNLDLLDSIAPDIQNLIEGQFFSQDDISEIMERVAENLKGKPGAGLIEDEIRSILLQQLGEQDARRRTLFETRPDFFVSLNETMRELDLIGPEALGKLTSEAQNLAAEGKPLATLFDSLGIPRDQIQTVVDFGSALRQAGFEAEDIPLLVAGIADADLKAGVENLLTTLITGFSNANFEAIKFSTTIKALADDLDDVINAANAFTFSPDFQARDIEAQIDRFMARLGEASTGIATPEAALFRAEGLEEQNALLEDFANILHSQVLAGLQEIRQISPEAFGEIKAQYNDAINAIGTSTLGDEARASLLVEAANLVASFNELLAQNKITPEVEFVYLESFNNIMEAAGVIDSTVLTIDVRFRVNEEDLARAFAAAEMFGGGGLGFGPTPDLVGGDPNAQATVMQGIAGLANQFGLTPAEIIERITQGDAAAIGQNIASAAGGGNKELSEFHKRLLEIQKAMKSLNITAEEFVALTRLTGIDETIGNLAPIFDKLGLSIKDFIPLLEKVNFEKIAKQLGASQQAIDNGTLQALFERLMPGITTNPELLPVLDNLAKFIEQLGDEEGEGLRNFARAEAGGAVTPQGIANPNPLAGLAEKGITTEEQLLQAIYAKDPNLLSQEQKTRIGKAYGDIIDKPTLALIGEAGPEVVLPLDKPHRMKELAKKAGIPMLGDGAIVGEQYWTPEQMAYINAVAMQKYMATPVGDSFGPGWTPQQLDYMNAIARAQGQNLPYPDVDPLTIALRQSLAGVGAYDASRPGVVFETLAPTQAAAGSVPTERYGFSSVEEARRALHEPNSREQYIQANEFFKARDRALSSAADSPDLYSEILGGDKFVGQRVADFVFEGGYGKYSLESATGISLSDIPGSQYPRGFLAELARPSSLIAIAASGGLANAGLKGRIAGEALLGAAQNAFVGQSVSPMTLGTGAAFGGGGEFGGAFARSFAGEGLANFTGKEIPGLKTLKPNTPMALEHDYVLSLNAGFRNLLRYFDEDAYNTMVRYAGADYYAPGRKAVIDAYDKLAQIPQFTATIEKLREFLPERILGLRSYDVDPNMLTARRLENFTTDLTTGTKFYSGRNFPNVGIGAIPREQWLGGASRGEYEFLADFMQFEKAGTPIADLLEIVDELQAERFLNEAPKFPTPSLDDIQREIEKILPDLVGEDIFAPERYSSFGNMRYPFGGKTFSTSVGSLPKTDNDLRRILAPQSSGSIYDFDSFKSIAPAAGSNAGGFYKFTPTGEEYYLKFYNTPEQAQMEQLANQIYKKIGIPVPDTHLIPDGGSYIFASKIIGQTPGSKLPFKIVPGDEQLLANRADVRNGFLADAFLANWDVLGLTNDNVLGIGDNIFRLDQGGTGIFRAQGTLKNFSGDAIPELANLRNPAFGAGKVFQDISDHEIQIMAKNLIDKLSFTDLIQMIGDSGLGAGSPIGEPLISRYQIIQAIAKGFPISDATGATSLAGTDASSFLISKGTTNKYAGPSGDYGHMGLALGKIKSTFALNSEQANRLYADYIFNNSNKSSAGLMDFASKNWTSYLPDLPFDTRPAKNEILESLMRQMDTPMAMGGITNGPTRALIGERGREAVIPLDRLNQVFPGARIGRDQGGAGGGESKRTMNITATIPVTGARDPMETAQAMRNRLMRIANRRERVLF